MCRYGYVTTILTAILGLHVIGVYGGVILHQFSLDTDPYSEDKIENDALRTTAIAFDVVQAFVFVYLIFQYHSKTYSEVKGLFLKPDPEYGQVDTNASHMSEFSKDVMISFCIAFIGNIICLIKFIVILST
jgi:hypothetical protein